MCCVDEGSYRNLRCSLHFHRLYNQIKSKAGPQETAVHIQDTLLIGTSSIIRTRECLLTFRGARQIVHKLNVMCWLCLGDIKCLQGRNLVQWWRCCLGGLHPHWSTCFQSYLCWFQLSANAHPGRHQEMAQVVEALPPRGRSGMSTWLLVSAWSSPAVVGI